VYIFKIGSTLTTASNAVVQVTGGAQACSVWWQIGTSATLGTGTQFQGNLMASASITMNTGANILTGRAMALNAALTLDDNRISPPVGACAAGTGATPSPSSTGTVPVPPTGAGNPNSMLLVVGVVMIVGGLTVAVGRRRTNRERPGPV
jgi:LPXTG-motif cell wall-anchored protein